jgi:hypothetical protein
MKEWHRTVILLLFIGILVALIIWARHIPIETLN